MKHPFVSILLLSLSLHLELCHCTQNQTQISQEEKDLKAAQTLTTRLKTFGSWIQQQAKSEDTFIGRCAGGFKKLRMAINFIIFKLGVIVTSLGFLSALTFKGLGIGVALLVMTAVGLSAKFFALKHSDDDHKQGSIHLHVHNKGGGHYPYPHDDHDHGWYDRLDHVVPKNDLERNAIADLYRRLGISESHGGSTYGTNRISIR